MCRVLGGRVEVLAEGHEAQQMYGGLERPKGTGAQQRLRPGAYVVAGVVCVCGGGGAGGCRGHILATLGLGWRWRYRCASGCRQPQPQLGPSHPNAPCPGTAADGRPPASLPRAGEDSERAPAFKQFVPGRDDRRYRAADKGGRGGRAQPPAAASSSSSGAQAAGGAAARALLGAAPAGGPAAGPKAAAGGARTSGPDAPAARPEPARALQLGLAPAHLLAPPQSGAAQARLMEQLQASESRAPPPPPCARVLPCACVCVCGGCGVAGRWLRAV
jgi:hypothetical protein